MISDGVFTGKFLRPTEAFALQQFNHTDLNRLGSDFFLWIIVLAGVALAIHFLLQRYPDLFRKKGRR